MESDHEFAFHGYGGDSDPAPGHETEESGPNDKLSQVEDGLHSLLEFCQALCSELSRGSAMDAELCGELVRQYYATLKVVQEILQEHVRDRPRGAPFNRSSYLERKALGVAQQSATLVHTLVGNVLRACDTV
eukprot:c35690_g1_i1.p1 GENE.c35690_g1_i1~~c35690_g1_i1.p1  ORF type:complete len:132 (-),score=11.72 c35690_g1_i1:203-598(-)